MLLGPFQLMASKMQHDITTNACQTHIHFIFNCTSNNILRKPFIGSLDSLCNNSKNLYNKEKFIRLICNECDTVIEILQTTL